MSANPKLAIHSIENWQSLFRNYKESLAKRLWSIPGISEAEKEILYKQYLVDLDDLEKSVARFLEDVVYKSELARDENDLLRSLLGVPEDELRARAVALNQEIQTHRKDIEELRDELGATGKQLSETAEEKEHIRERLREFEQKADQFRAQQIRLREDDVKFFTESHESLKDHLADLATRLSNLKSLFTETNEQLVYEKQEEITHLQKKLLDEMEEALQQKQKILWQEEEAFAKGVAHRVRTSLVSLQGQFLLTLERLGLLDPESKSETFWKARWNLLRDGAEELGQNFKEIQSQLQKVTETLDDYLQLTHRRKMIEEPVLINELVEKELATIYADRKPTLAIEFIPDDPLPAIKGDPELLQFVVSALMRNAVESLRNEVGHVTILLKNRSDRHVVQFQIQDTGDGIPEYLQPRLFEPFFTTKNGHQGLSLSRIKRYVELHNGKIELLSSGPKGTSFLLEFPVGS